MTSQQPVYVFQQEPATVVTVVSTGNCPSCRTGMLQERYTLCGILWAIFFFPIGLICCLTMRVKSCNMCGYTLV